MINVRELVKKLEATGEIVFHCGESIVHIWETEQGDENVRGEEYMNFMYSLYENNDKFEGLHVSEDYNGGLCTGYPKDAIEMALEQVAQGDIMETTNNREVTLQECVICLCEQEFHNNVCTKCGNEQIGAINSLNEENSNLAEENKNMAKALESMGFSLDEITAIAYGSTPMQIKTTNEENKESGIKSIFSENEREAVEDILIVECMSSLINDVNTQDYDVLAAAVSGVGFTQINYLTDEQLITELARILDDDLDYKSHAGIMEHKALVDNETEKYFPMAKDKILTLQGHPPRTTQVVYQSIWEEGVVSTTALLNLVTGEITDIESSDEGSHYEFHIYDVIYFDEHKFHVEEDERGLMYSISLEDLQEIKVKG